MTSGEPTRRGREAARPAAAPTGVRLGLALFGLAVSVIGLVVLGLAGSGWGVAFFAVLTVLTLADTVLLAYRLRRVRR